MQSRNENPFRNKQGEVENNRNNNSFKGGAVSKNSYKFQSKNKKHNFSNKNSLLRQKEKFDPEKAVEDSTPWHQFKEELLQKSESHNKDQQNLNGQSKEEIEKVRQQNYRKFMMKKKQKEPVQWERFSPEPNTSKSNEQHNQMKIIKKEQQYQKTKLNQRIKNNKERFVKNSVLTPKENDYLRKVITHTSMLARKFTLHDAVIGLKNRRDKLNKEKVFKELSKKQLKNKKNKGQ